MANIINGTDTGSGGLITTGDSSDELQLQTAETARVTLTNTAVVVNEGGNDVDFRVEGDTDANLLFVDAGNDRVGVGTNSPAVAFDVVGQVRASTGILFGGDTAAANALDDYEEGTWTPAWDGSGSTTYNSATTKGRYTKIGNTCCAWGVVSSETLTQSSTLVQITLPFTVKSDQANFGAISVFIENGVNSAGGAGNIQALNRAGSAIIEFYVIASSTTQNYTNLTYNDLQAAAITRIRFTTVFEVA